MGQVWNPEGESRMHMKRFVRGFTCDVSYVPGAGTVYVDNNAIQISTGPVPVFTLPIPQSCHDRAMRGIRGKCSYFSATVQ